MSDTRVAELKSALQQRLDFINEGLNKGVKVEGQNVTVSAEDAKAIQGAMAEASEIKNLILAEKFGAETKAWMEQPVEESVAMHATQPIRQAKSLGEIVTQHEEFKNLVASGAYTMPNKIQIEAMDVPSMGYKDVWTGSTTSAIDRGIGTRVQFDPMIPRPQRQARVRDLFPVAGTNANLIDFFRVLGFAEGGGAGAARSVRERAAADGVGAPTGAATDTFGLKPKSNLRFESAQAPVRTIAHWEAAHRNALQDIPQMEATINNELLYGLRLEEDRQILMGTGLNEELLGILNTPGIQAYTQPGTAAAPGETRTDTLRRAATRVLIANYQPTGYVMHPYDWESVELQKDNNGAYMLVTNIAVGAQQTVWRQPVVDTPAIPEGTALTGAFGLGAQLYDRQQANVRIAEQHEDFFVRNAIAILVEERLALACRRPESFSRIDFAV